MFKTQIRIFSLLALSLLALGTSACEKEKAENQKAPKTEEPTKTAEAKPATEAPTQAPPTADRAGKLKVIMLGIGGEMGVIQNALWTENYEIIATRAMKVADHPKVNDSEKARIMKTLGDDFGAFVAMDKAVHGGAVRLSEAATAKHLPNTLNEFAQLQNNCVTCHSQFRSRLRE